MKSGYKTTEFWVTIGLQIVGVVMIAMCPTCDSSAGTCTEGVPILCRVLGFAIMAASALGYSVSRGMAKKGAN